MVCILYPNASVQDWGTYLLSMFKTPVFWGDLSSSGGVRCLIDDTLGEGIMANSGNKSRSNFGVGTSESVFCMHVKFKSILKIGEARFASAKLPPQAASLSRFFSLIIGLKGRYLNLSCAKSFFCVLRADLAGWYCNLDRQILTLMQEEECKGPFSLLEDPASSSLILRMP
eukprot:1136632-Pelagomonas_calceolata.AAC.2